MRLRLLRLLHCRSTDATGADRLTYLRFKLRLGLPARRYASLRRLLLDANFVHVQPGDEPQSHLQRRSQPADDRLQVRLHHVTDEHVLDVVEQVANRVHVFEGGRGLGLVDLFQQFVQDKRDVGDGAGTFRAQAVQEGTDHVTQVDQLVLGFDYGLELFLDEAGLCGIERLIKGLQLTRIVEDLLGNGRDLTDSAVMEDTLGDRQDHDVILFEHCLLDDFEVEHFEWTLSVCPVSHLD